MANKFFRFKSISLPCFERIQTVYSIRETRFSSCNKELRMCCLWYHQITFDRSRPTKKSASNHDPRKRAGGGGNSIWIPMVYHCYFVWSVCKMKTETMQGRKRKKENNKKDDDGSS
jgi:hypothetical protein